jgi:hypothetical protein
VARETSAVVRPRGSERIEVVTTGSSSSKESKEVSIGGFPERRSKKDRFIVMVGKY